MSFAEIIKTKPDYIGANGRTDTEIEKAENELGITFAEDYREYLREIGLACFDGHELTGLTNTFTERCIPQLGECEEVC